MEGGLDISNLGAILFAKEVSKFPSIATKAVRIVRYTGDDKQKSDREYQGSKGYAVGFSGMVKYTMDHIPHDETYVNGVRKLTPQYPETASAVRIARNDRDGKWADIASPAEEGQKVSASL
jgi:predicted HTH transcriptional regulator